MYKTDIKFANVDFETGLCLTIQMETNRKWQKIHFLLIPFQVSEFLFVFSINAIKNEKSGSGVSIFGLYTATKWF